MDIIEESHANAGASRPPNTDLSEESKKRTSEEADLEDQDPESDRKKLQQRREANRVHAFKSRQRSKHLLSELQTTVNELAKDKSELERHNAVLRAQVEVLQQQNLSLLQNQQQMMLQQKGPSQLPQSLSNHAAAFNFGSNPFMAAAAAAAAASNMGGASAFGNNASLAMLATMMGAAANPGPNAAALAMMNSLVGGQAAPSRANLGEEASAEHSALPPQSAPPALSDLPSVRGAEAGAGNS